MTAAIIVAIICLSLVLISGMFFNSMENIEKYKADIIKEEFIKNMKIKFEEFEDKEKENE